jgi:hypothetical protein
MCVLHRLEGRIEHPRWGHGSFAVLRIGNRRPVGIQTRVLPTEELAGPCTLFHVVDDDVKTFAGDAVVLVFLGDKECDR